MASFFCGWVDTKYQERIAHHIFPIEWHGPFFHTPLTQLAPEQRASLTIAATHLCVENREVYPSKWIWYQTPYALVLASEPYGIHSFPGFIHTTNLIALASFMAYGRIPYDQTPWEAVYRLPPFTQLQLTTSGALSYTPLPHPPLSPTKKKTYAPPTSHLYNASLQLLAQQNIAMLCHQEKNVHLFAESDPHYPFFDPASVYENKETYSLMYEQILAETFWQEASPLERQLVQQWERWLAQQKKCWRETATSLRTM